MVFQTRILLGVGWIGTPHLGLANFWDLLWCLGLPTNSRVLLNPLPRQSIAAASCCSQLLWITYTMSDFGDEYTHVPLQ
jgi:hypothetical protein